MPKEKDQEKQEPTAEEILAEKKARGDFVEEEPEMQASEEEDEGTIDAEEEEAEPEVKAEEEEEEPELEAGAEAEEEEDEPGDKDEPIMIPKSRFDEVRQRAKDKEAELQRRLDAAEERKEKETTTENVSDLEKELDELDSQYTQLLLEGEVDKANEVRKNWRQRQNDLFDIRLEQRSTMASKQAIEGMRFDRQLAEYEVKFPAINPDSEDFDPDTAQEVRELMDAFESRGWNSVAALNKAIKYVIPENPQQEVDTPDPGVVRSKRQVASRKKVAKAAKNSPPDITDKGRDTDKVGTGDGLPDVTKMTPDQFAELSETQLRKLRGDTITDQEANS